MAAPTAASPRLTPTLALAAAWLALYLLYLGVRPERPEPVKARDLVTTTTTQGPERGR